ncbi:MAG: signal peptidase I, partial [Alistipes sp.]|nr:signal peptidase I [Alistipes sp.]
MSSIKEIYSTVKGWLTNRWVAFGCVAIIVALFAIWYGAWWSLFVALPLIFDYYITKRIAGLHHKLSQQYAWWRIAWGAWCALVFAVVVGVLIYMLAFRWNSSAIVLWIVVAAVFGYALWNEIKEETTIYKWLYSWVHAIIFATVVATLIQLYWFQMFVIPTGSMESTLMAGDYILVNKVSYGPRVPMTPLSFPFVHNTMPLNDTKPSFSTSWERSYRRLAGSDHVKRGDVVVFNFPEGDTVVMEMPAMSYYELLRSDELGATVAERRENILKDYTIAVRPLD